MERRDAISEIDATQLGIVPERDPFVLVPQQILVLGIHISGLSGGCDILILCDFGGGRFSHLPNWLYLGHI